MLNHKVLGKIHKNQVGLPTWVKSSDIQKYLIILSYFLIRMISYGDSCRFKVLGSGIPEHLGGVFSSPDVQELEVSPPILGFVELRARSLGKYQNDGMLAHVILALLTYRDFCGAINIAGGVQNNALSELLS